MNTNRRRFLQSSLGASTLLSASATVPHLLARTAAAASKKGATKKSGENILVVVQLSGGNDGLNTVVPYADPIYEKNRIALRIDRASVVKLDDEVGLHPNLKPLAKLAEQGRLAVVQGVGYPNPDRSHFSSMDVWHTAERKPELQRDGWLGRAVEHTTRAAGAAAPALHLGGGPLPLALSSRTVAIPSVESLDGFKLTGRRGVDLAALREVAEAERPDGGEMLAFLQRTTLGAYESSERVQAALGLEADAATYPGHRLAQKLKNIARLIDADLETTIYYVSLDGFDTHANQRQSHANLMTELAESVAAFLTDLTERGHVDRTTVLMFSEFGRRVKENASAGTDHGAAAPLFVAGGGLRKAGIVGKHPSLEDLDREGDLKFHTDFRSVYAAILEGRLGAASRDVLGGDYVPTPLFG
ncbi:MAG: DUF1501 domain-containing protein [Planctomycetes bacterium]|nr:DUF1501 domain-containing protein [Planctomycetota bacterium]